MSSLLRRKTVAIGAITIAILLSLLLLPACCCVKPPAVSTTPEPSRIPPIGTVDFPVPDVAKAKEPTQVFMRNVDFHIDPGTIMSIDELRGAMAAKKAGDPLNFDNKTTFILKIDTARIALHPASLDNLMNRYVFGYPGAALRDLHASMAGKQLVQQGIMHKIVDIPFTMWADVSADNGLIRIHPTKVDICGINGLGLLKAVGMTFEKMLNIPPGHGVKAEKNDLLLDPEKILPPPQIEGHLADVRVQGDELVQIFDAGEHLPPLTLPKPGARNTMYYRGGTLRMGKLLMIDADMQVIDLDPSDRFDFFIDRYNEQLVEGCSHNQPNYGLVVYMVDFSDLGKGSSPQSPCGAEDR